MIKMRERAYKTCLEAGVDPSTGALGLTCAIEFVVKGINKIVNLVK